MKNILVAVSGLTPQIITETIYWYSVVRESPVTMDEVHILTTLEGERLVKEKLLGIGGDDPQANLEKLINDYSLPPIEFSINNVHVFGAKTPLRDIRNGEESLEVANKFIGFIRDLSDATDNVLYCTIAGGRKTQSVYMAMAIQMYGREKDRLSHVLARKDLETSGFYYPLPGVDYMENEKGSCIELLEIPCFSVRELIPKDKHYKLEDLISAAQSKIDLAVSPELTVDLPQKRLRSSGAEIKLPAKRLAFYAMFIDIKMRCNKSECLDCTDCYMQAADFLSEENHTVFLKNYRRVAGESQGVWTAEDKYAEFVDGDVDADYFLRDFRTIMSRINTTLANKLNYGFADLKIREIKRPGQVTKYGIALVNDKITFITGD